MISREKPLRFASGPYQGAYTAAGIFGQLISVLPTLDMVVVHKVYWSPTSPRHNVNLTAYSRLLDLLTGKRPASEAELRQWKEAVKARANAGGGGTKSVP